MRNVIQGFHMDSMMVPYTRVSSIENFHPRIQKIEKQTDNKGKKSKNPIEMTASSEWIDQINACSHIDISRSAGAYLLQSIF